MYYPIHGVGSFSLKRRLLKLFSNQVDENEGVKLVHALKNINLEIIDGDKVGIIGANGAGKTTLLKLISGVYSPFNGTKKIIGNINSLVDINFGIDPELSGRVNIKLRGMLMGYSNDYIESMTESIISFANLGNFINAPVYTYSSGMNIRLAFAISVHFESDIILMDEWLSVGDKNFKFIAQKKLLNIINKSNILILSSHDPSIIKNICNRIVCLDKGEIIEDSRQVNKVVDDFFN